MNHAVSPGAYFNDIIEMERRFTLVSNAITLRMCGVFVVVVFFTQLLPQLLWGTDAGKENINE